MLLNLINNNNNNNSNLFIFISSYVFLSLYKNKNKQRTDINAKIYNPNALLTNYKSLKEKTNKQTNMRLYTQVQIRIRIDVILTLLLNKD